MTKTAQKKKDRLKQIKQKKKDKKANAAIDSEDDSNDIVEFGSRADGYIRPSDRGDVKPYFAGPEKIKFGEVASAPPDLATLGSKLFKKKNPILASISNNDDSEDEDETRKRKFKKLKLSERNDMDGDDKLETISSTAMPLSLNKKKAEPVSHSKAVELEKLRQQAMASYKLLKEKRKQQG